ncbi:hypothetical protein ES319_A06G124400v1 [Gossypium barbadense]|uniref:Uncharacterized protein n=2 Tax=Gossypium TaxID=3633 RepID=A0A5J5VDN1_GOSBA|nr:hypothetical protein ES319_A06G124400v1 [Gossypium barbadense]TYH13432.1 hypothetical protein ES288_A06G139100v1 [Gossypium darwinii]TYH13433.1 hypothetical protein ES288_A06G139100v1 [Gossypium darwinii]
MKNLQHNLPLQRILKNPLSSVNLIFPILLHNFSNRFWRIVKPKTSNLSSATFQSQNVCCTISLPRHKQSSVS